jgi:hypothetical protein
MGSPIQTTSLFLPLILGTAGTLCICAGGMLRGRISPAVQRVGTCACAFGLGLMSLGVLCLAGGLALV